MKITVKCQMTQKDWLTSLKANDKTKQKTTEQSTAEWAIKLLRTV